VPKLSSLVVSTALVAASALAFAPVASAQRVAVRGAVRPVVVRPGFRSGGFGYGFGLGFGYPYWYGPWYGPYAYGYPYGPYPYYGGYEAFDVASLRLEITPKQAEVFVDGYRAGTVDQFDGIFHRLHVRPGGHDLVVYLPGYRTFEEHVYASPASSQSIKMTLEPLAPGEAMTPPPVPAPPPPPEAGYGRGNGMRMMPPVQVGPGGGSMPPQGPPPPPTEPPPPPPPPPVNEAPPPPTDPSAYGTLALRVQPSAGPGSVILIDGERWATRGTTDQLLVRLAEGKHHVEIRQLGFVPFVTDVDIRRGDSTPLNVSLVRRDH
jgi:hypothetical protein